MTTKQNVQRFLILRNNEKVIGTDGGKPFTEAAAKAKVIFLQDADPKSTYEVLEITPFFLTFK